MLFFQSTYNHEFYAKAANMVPAVTSAYGKAFADYDVLIMPTLPYLPPKLPAKDVSIPGRGDNEISIAISGIANL